MRRLYNKFRKSVQELEKANEEIEKIACMAKVMETSIVKLDSIKNTAKIVVDSEDKKFQALAGTVEKKLIEESDNCL